MSSFSAAPPSAFQGWMLYLSPPLSLVFQEARWCFQQPRLGITFAARKKESASERKKGKESRGQERTVHLLMSPYRSPDLSYRERADASA